MSKERITNHCVNVAALSASFGHYLGLPNKTVKILSAGGFLHDIGKVRIPEHILHKTGYLSDDDFIHVKKHVNHTVDTLQQSKNVPEGVVLMAQQHHERSDGSGYPNGLTGSEISIYGKIGAIADLYDSMTTDLNQNRALPPHTVVRKLYLMRHQLSEEYVEKFILFLGIYPIGTYLLLNTDEIAVVVGNNRDKPLYPLVRKVTNAKGFRITSPRLINLADQADNKEKYYIVQPVKGSERGLPVFHNL